MNRTDVPPAGSADKLAARLEALPPNHPSSPDFQGGDITRKAGGDRKDGAAEAVHRARKGDLTPLDDAAYEVHVRMVEKRLDAAERAGMSSEMLYTIDPDHKIWSKDRLAQRGRLTADMYHARDDVPGDGRAVIAGGIAGAGKTTVLESFAGIDRSRYLTVNPDEVKEKLAERRMIPDVDGLAPMERSGLVHEDRLRRHLTWRHGLTRIGGT